MRGIGVNKLLSIFAFLNLGFILTYIIGQNFIFNKKINPNVVASYALFLSGFFVSYFILIVAILLFGLITKEYLTLLFGIFLALPFLIGKRATFKTLNVYSNIQLLSLFGSLFYSLLLIVKDY